MKQDFVKIDINRLDENDLRTLAEIIYRNEIHSNPLGGEGMRDVKKINDREMYLVING